MALLVGRGVIAQAPSNSRNTIIKEKFKNSKIKEICRFQHETIESRVFF
jgi:hypothetical protein